MVRGSDRSYEELINTSDLCEFVRGGAGGDTVGWSNSAMPASPSLLRSPTCELPVTPAIESSTRRGSGGRQGDTQLL